MSNTIDHAVVFQVLETLSGPLMEHGSWEYIGENEGQPALFVYGTYAHMTIVAEDLIKAVEEGDGIVPLLGATLVDFANMLNDIADAIYLHVNPAGLEAPNDDA